MDLDLERAAWRFKQWSLYRLAIEMDLPSQSVYSWNKGRIIPTLRNISKICKALNCTPNDLLGFSRKHPSA